MKSAWLGACLFVAVVIFLGAAIPSSQPKEPKWQYTVLRRAKLPVAPYERFCSCGRREIQIDKNVVLAVDALKVMGENGWELIAAMHEPPGLDTGHSEGDDYFYMKKRGN